ncbi:hypothetical protein HA402_003331 [Bradysia odoriphaga]|nr:hypothetical protein HA402_003331 [Bradysia odoriphaga]
MAMAACYSSYDLSGSQGVPTHHQVQSQQQIVPITVQQSSRLSTSQSSQKDYSLPLHVDCSVEYELPNQAKPPTGARIEPLLMIHPCYFRKMESQRRSPFINNMPNSNRNSATVAIVPTLSSSTSTSSSNTTSIRKSSRINNQSSSQHLAQQIQQQQMSQMSQQAHYPVVQQQQQQQPHSLQSQRQQQPSRRAVIHCQNQVQISNNSAWDQIQTPSAVVAGGSGGRVCNSSGLTMSNVGIQQGTVNLTGQSMYSKPIGKRNEAMLSGGGCGGVYSNNNNTTLNNNNISNSSDFRVSNVRWEPERSPMAAIPRDYQAGPDAMPLISNRDDKHILSGKYRQYLRSHRLHPYMTGSTGSTFPQLTTSTFPQMQQVSCYNV